MSKREVESQLKKNKLYIKEITCLTSSLFGIIQFFIVHWSRTMYKAVSQFQKGSNACFYDWVVLSK